MNPSAKKYKIGKKIFDFNNAYVMGILNVTPDSFSDGGKYFKKNMAVKKSLKMLNDGADIIDIGGESTRPGSEPVSIDEELKRVIPVIKDIIKQQPDAVISIDTSKNSVAEEALKAGALIVNDISGLTFEPEIAGTVAKNGAALIIMHIKGEPKTMQQQPFYDDVIAEVFDFLRAQTKIAEKNGIEKIIIDPGIGFGKRLEDNLKLIRRLDEFNSLYYPLLIGISRKSFIGNVLNLEVDKRDDVTNSLNSYAIGKGVRIIRTHNVKQGVETCKIMNKLLAA